MYQDGEYIQFENDEPELLSMPTRIRIEVAGAAANTALRIVEGCYEFAQEAQTTASHGRSGDIQKAISRAEKIKPLALQLAEISAKDFADHIEAFTFTQD